MSNNQKDKASLESNLFVLKNSIMINLPNCKEEDIESNIYYSSDEDYTNTFTINFYDSNNKRTYRNFSITGKYSPISEFEYEGEKYSFIITTDKFINKVQEVLNDLGATW